MHDLAILTAADLLVCRLQAELPAMTLSAASVTGQQITYQVDQRGGPILFSVDQCGLFEAQGRLNRYWGTLSLERRMPLELRTDLAFDMASITLAEPRQNALPFTPQFDLASHASVRFRSTALTPDGLGRCVGRGLLEIGGATHLQTFDAQLVSHLIDPITGTEVAEVLIHCCLLASAFGLQPGQPFLSDRVELQIRARIELDA